MSTAPTRPKCPNPELMGTFLQCAGRGDLAGMEALVAQGLDLAAPDDFGDSVLTRLIDNLQDSPREHVLAMVKEAVRLGADPQQLDIDRGNVFGPLVQAMLYMDGPLLDFLLSSGADSNALREDGQLSSLYDWAWMDYQLEVWDINKIPEEPSEADEATEEGWIAFFDRTAVKHGRRRPDYIAVLREHGAMTLQEMKAAGLK